MRGGIHIKSVLKGIFAGRSGWPVESSLPPQGPQASHSPCWPCFLGGKQVSKTYFTRKLQGLREIRKE